MNATLPHFSSEQNAMEFVHGRIIEEERESEGIDQEEKEFAKKYMRKSRGGTQNSAEDFMINAHEIQRQIENK